MARKTTGRKKAGGGSNLNRSEVVTVRFDPRLRYLAEIAARKQRRTVSSFIEWAVETALEQVTLAEGGAFGEVRETVAGEARRLWDADESERFVRLAILYPELLTFDEQQKWKAIQDSGLLSPARTEHGFDWKVLEAKVFPSIRRRWRELTEACDKGWDAAMQWAQDVQASIGQGR